MKKLWLAVAFSLLPCASAGGGSFSPAMLAGHWAGDVYEPDSGLRYSLSLKLLAQPDGTGHIGYATYSGASNCQTSWTLTGQRDRTLMVREEVQAGACINVNLEVSLERSGKSPLLRVTTHDTAYGLPGEEVTLEARLLRRSAAGHP